MRGLLRNKYVVIALLLLLAAGAAFNWYGYLQAQVAQSEVLSGLLPPAVAPPAPSAESFGGAGEGLLQLRRVPDETVEAFAARFGLSGERAVELAALNSPPPAEDPLLMVVPRNIALEMKPPRDPFLLPSEEPTLFQKVLSSAQSIKEPKLEEITAIIRGGGSSPVAPDELADGGRRLEVVVVPTGQPGGTVSMGKRVLAVGDRFGRYRVQVVSVDGVLLQKDDGEKTFVTFEEKTPRLEVQVTGADPAGGGDGQ